jgi:ribosome biogenesis protein Nip4
MLFSLFLISTQNCRKGEGKVEIRIREVDPIAVKKIDEIAKRKGLSRQKFLKDQIEMLAFFQQQIKREMELENIIQKKNILMMNDCYSEMKKMNEFIQMMMQDDENE